jgi:hypothetical protein
MNCAVSGWLDFMKFIVESRIFSCVVSSGVGVGVGYVEIVGVGFCVGVGLVGIVEVGVGEAVGLGEGVGVGEASW